MDLLYFICGVCAGFGVTMVFYYFKDTYRKTNGVLKIDHSNPEKDIYRFEIDEIDNIASKTCIVLHIDHEADLSQNNHGLL